jgi:hypothetical protein
MVWSVLVDSRLAEPGDRPTRSCRGPTSIGTVKRSALSRAGRSTADARTLVGPYTRGKVHQHEFLRTLRRSGSVRVTAVVASLMRTLTFFGDAVSPQAAVDNDTAGSFGAQSTTAMTNDNQVHDLGLPSRQRIVTNRRASYAY